LFIGVASPRQDPASREAGKEDGMELRIGLNVVAAVMSFAFLAAIALGMF